MNLMSVDCRANRSFAYSLRYLSFHLVLGTKGPNACRAVRSLVAQYGVGSFRPLLVDSLVIATSVTPGASDELRLLFRTPAYVQAS